MKDKTKDIWMDFEGDNWFARNKKNLESKDIKKKDFPLFMIKLYELKPKKVLEIGASNGYRLAEINKLYKSKVAAVEPSQEAIKDGQKRYPFIKFIRGACDNVSLKEKFDLIIVNFVFHWIYRDKLYNSIASMDKILSDGGYLIIGDFGTDCFIKRKYHHLKNVDFYTWKMPYWKLFTKSGRYIETAKLRFNHDTNSMDSKINIDNMGTIVLLRKQDCFTEI